eukprot:GHVS01107020.1.p1 GENE.GHVS01107020.1~~GHVS01107020.1.p1  ORF type:complete len:416 (+),score=37.44 GHVS01107020.1:182-1429(+)
MAHLSSTSLFLLVALATVLVFSASCLFVLANPFPITRATLQNCKVGDLSFSEAARLDDFFVQPYETSIVEGIEIVHVAYDEGKNTLTVNDNYGSTEVPKPWFVVTRSAEEKALIIPTTNADYVWYMKNVGTAANARQTAALTNPNITLERGDFSEKEAGQFARFLISVHSQEQYLESFKKAFTSRLQGRVDSFRIARIFDTLVIYEVVEPFTIVLKKASIGCIYNAYNHTGFYSHTLQFIIHIGSESKQFIVFYERDLGTEKTKPQYVKYFDEPVQAEPQEIAKLMRFGAKQDEAIGFLTAQDNTLMNDHQHRLQLYLDGNKLMVHSSEDAFRGDVIALEPAVGHMDDDIAFDVTVSIDTPGMTKEPLARLSIEDGPPKSLKLIFTIHFRLVANGPFKKGAYWSQSRETTGLVLA